MGEQAVRAATVILVGLLAASAGAPALAADPAAGKAIFASQCAMCHSIESGRNSLRAQPIRHSRAENGVGAGLPLLYRK